ncbi:MAG: type II secretion system protein GspM [Sphingomonadales bacterium]|nr:type II secretion system protein GspM [Sphingomonadales bacterium]
MQAFSPSIRRLLAVLLLLAVVSSVFLFVLQPVYLAFSGRVDAVAHKTAAISRYRALEASRPELSARVAALTGSGLVGRLYPGMAANQAAALLQDDFSQAAARHGIQLDTVRTLQTTREGGFQRIGVQVSFTADVPALTALLRDLTGGQRFVFVDNVTVRASANQNAAEPVPLSVRADVMAFLEDETSWP